MKNDEIQNRMLLDPETFPKFEQPTGWYLLVFYFFIVTDLANLIIIPTILTALPMIIHAVFLPLLLYIVYKQRHGVILPTTMIAYVQLLIMYMITYLVTGFVVAIILSNFFTIGIDAVIGICMLSIWYKVLQQMQ